jgi:hypothetical protein
MSISRFSGCALGLGLVFALTNAPPAAAQGDTTRRPASEQRIPVRKGQITRQESGGEVALPLAPERIDALGITALSLRTRLASLERANATLRTSTQLEMRLLRDSMRLVEYELYAMRRDLSEATAFNVALADSLARINARVEALNRSNSVFGSSGFYAGVGAGANLTTGTLHKIGYHPSFNVSVPIGWSRPDALLGVRTELGMQLFEGTLVQGFRNPDPTLYSATGMVTMNLPLNLARNHLLYLMGGGGLFLFRDFGPASGLADRLATSSTTTKWGVTGGAGLELHVLGATSLFVESSITNVFVHRGSGIGGAGRNLRWIPVIAGLQLR